MALASSHFEEDLKETHVVGVRGAEYVLQKRGPFGGLVHGVTLPGNFAMTEGEGWSWRLPNGSLTPAPIRGGRRMSPSIRPAVPADALRVTECVHAAYEPWVPRLGRRPWPMLQDYSAVIETERVFVAELEGRVCGVLVLSETSDGFLIDNVAVVPALKGEGVGRALLMRAEREAKARGSDSIDLYTNEKMSENIALYAKIGYAEYERRQEEGFRRVFMRKSLR